MNDNRNEIPEQFYRGSLPKPVASTVSELIGELSKLPPNLPVDPDEDGVALTVYNVGYSAHLSFSEGYEELARQDGGYWDERY